MSEPASISAGIAARYASAIFELAKDENSISALEKDLDALEAAVASGELPLGRVRTSVERVVALKGVGPCALGGG